MSDNLNILKDADANGASTGVKTGLIAAFRHLLRPLIKILIRNGIAFGEFAEAVKAVYVEVASSEFELPGRKTSGSRIAILTGLTRKEVKRVTELLRPQGAIVPNESSSNLNRATRVLSGWHQDPEFTGPYGIPLELSFEGGISFTELVRRYSGDMPARAMLEELKRVEAVEEFEPNQLRVLSRYYIAAQIDPAHSQYIGDVIHDLAATIEFNFDPNREEPARFERWVATEKARSDAMPEFRNMVRQRGQRFLESLDNWLSMHEIKTEKPGKSDAIKTRVGIYFYEEVSNGDSEK